MLNLPLNNTNLCVCSLLATGDRCGFRHGDALNTSAWFPSSINALSIPCSWMCTRFSGTFLSCRKTNGTRLLSDHQCIVDAIIVRIPSYGSILVTPSSVHHLSYQRVMRCTHIIEMLVAHHGLSHCVVFVISFW